MRSRIQFLRSIVISTVLPLLVVVCAIKIVFGSFWLTYLGFSTTGGLSAEYRGLYSAYVVMMLAGSAMAVCGISLLVGVFHYINKRGLIKLVRATNVISILICVSHLVFVTTVTPSGDVLTFKNALLTFAGAYRWLPMLMIFAVACFEVLVHVHSVPGQPSTKYNYN